MSSPFAPASFPAPCRPPLWARSGHGQTILSHLLPTRAPALDPNQDRVTVHDVPLEDGDRLRAFHHPGTTDVLVMIFHGLSGDSSADYVRLAIGAARRSGHSVLAVNHRGCGAGRGLARGLYHSGRGDDLGAVCAYAREHLPESRRLIVGFSLSGNALLLNLQRRDWEQPDAGIAINPPVHLEHCSERISSGVNRVYDQRFVRRCTRLLRERVEDGLLPRDYAIPKVATLWEFDERVTAPLGGFADARDYYARCSTWQGFEAIERPVVLLTAADDPFVPVEDFEGARKAPCVHLHVEPTGGHVGYLEGIAGRLGARKWLSGALEHYLGRADRSALNEEGGP